jgi:tetratricopeptide (TPR) repeat protein
MHLRLTAFALALALSAPVIAPRAQTTPAEHIAEGDRDRMDPAAQLRHYEAALAEAPNNYDALYKASEAAINEGLLATDESAARALYAKGESYARRAIQLNPQGADGHFAIANALGRTALSLGKRDRVKYAGEVRDHALEALRIDPRHEGALHVMGSWNAEVMRLSGVTRFMAKNFLGGKVFDSANWDDAQRYLEQAVEAAPTRLVHRIDLAQVYLDRSNKAKAREQLEYIVRAPALEANDVRYKRQAQELLAKLR